MIQQGFWVNKEIPIRWWFMVYLNVNTKADLTKVYGALLGIGATENKAKQAIGVLSVENNAYIHTNFDEHCTVIALAKTTSCTEFMNSIFHELQHATSHLCEYFFIDSQSEQAGYLQGEIGENLYKGVALCICPKCNCKN